MSKNHIFNMMIMVCLIANYDMHIYVHTRCSSKQVLKRETEHGKIVITIKIFPELFFLIIFSNFILFAGSLLNQKLQSLRKPGQKIGLRHDQQNVFYSTWPPTDLWAHTSQPTLQPCLIALLLHTRSHRIVMRIWTQSEWLLNEKWYVQKSTVQKNCKP